MPGLTCIGGAVMATNSDKALLRILPAVHDVVDNYISDTGISQPLVVHLVRDIIDELRNDILNGEEPPGKTKKELLAWIVDTLTDRVRPGIREVINATGVVLHTGLGRAPIPDAARDALLWSSRYCNVQSDLQSGKRCRRDPHVEKLLKYITGCESAFVVNNNAAATLLTLSALCAGKEVIVSRGELVEIGGSYRIPDVMAQSGALLREVGCTNKTKIGDYAGAITDQTAALMKVHTSNYKILGFTESVSIEELSALGRSNDVMVIHDMGSGSLIDLEPFGLSGEPTAAESLAQGADIVTFSGDKLIGGPQAGIIIGSRAIVDMLRNHPLARAVRVDKLVLSAMEATLRHFVDPADAARNVPGIRMITMKYEEIAPRVKKFKRRLVRLLPEHEIEIVDGVSKVGSGAFPIQELPSVLITVCPKDMGAETAARLLRLSNPSVFVRVAQDVILIDLRTVFPEEEVHLMRCLGEVLRNC